MTGQTDHEDTQKAIPEAAKTNGKTRTRKTSKTSSGTKTAKASKAPRTVTLIAKSNPFPKDTVRHAKWNCLRDGATVADTKALMTKRGLVNRSNFLRRCVAEGYIEIK